MRAGLKSAVYALVVLLLPVAILALLISVDRATLADSAHWVRSAQIIDPGREQRVELPWTGSRHGSSAIKRVRANIAFSVPEVGAAESREGLSRALLIPRPFTAFELELNGVLFARHGQMTVPLSWLRWPVLVYLPDGLLLPDDNLLTIHSARESSSAYLPSMLLGPVSELKPVYDSQMLFGVYAVRAVIVAMLVLALLLLGLFLLRRGETAYGWFSLTLLIWSMHTAHDQIEHIPILSRHLWFALSYLSLGWFVIVATVFVHRFLEISPRRIEACLWVAGVAGSALLISRAAVCGECFYASAQYLWVPVIVIIGVYLVARLLLRALQDPRPQYKALLLAAWIACVVGLRDFLWELGLLTAGSTYYLAYASALVLGVFALILLRRFAAALREAETLNLELESRVSSKAAQLQQNFDALRRTEQQRARLAERELIMRDMHDSLGGNLVQALAIMDRDRQPAAAREVVERCLTDLRIILDSSQLEGGDLVPLVAAFRHRVERGLRRAGIELTLVMSDLPACACLSGGESLHILRIMQEAVNNVVKHAKADRITLRLSYSEAQNGSLLLCMRDNGIGMRLAETSTGRGLGNMQWRAQAIGAVLAHVAMEPGTEVQLLLPLIRPEGLQETAAGATGGR